MTINEKTIDGKKFVLYIEVPSKRGAQQIAAKVRKDVPYKGYLVRVVETSRIWHGFYNKFWGVYIHDGTKKPWRT